MSEIRPPRHHLTSFYISSSGAAIITLSFLGNHLHNFALCFLFLSSGFFAQWENLLRRDGESAWNVRVGLVVNLFYSHIFVCVSHLWFVIWDESEGHSGYVHRSLGWKGWAQLCTGESSGTILLVRFIGVAPCSHTVEQCATDGTHIVLPHQSVEASC